MKTDKKLTVQDKLKVGIILFFGVILFLIGAFALTIILKMSERAYNNLMQHDNVIGFIGFITGIVLLSYGIIKIFSVTKKHFKN